MSEIAAWPPGCISSEVGKYYWLHSERSSYPAIAQWMGLAWSVIGETHQVTPEEMGERGWELLGPAKRPFSKYLDG